MSYRHNIYILILSFVLILSFISPFVNSSSTKKDAIPGRINDELDKNNDADTANLYHYYSLISSSPSSILRSIKDVKREVKGRQLINHQTTSNTVVETKNIANTTALIYEELVHQSTPIINYSETIPTTDIIYKRRSIIQSSFLPRSLKIANSAGDKHRMFDVERLGMTSFFLAVVYAVLLVISIFRYTSITKFVAVWTSEKTLYFAVVVHLTIRTVGFSVLAVFTLMNTDVYYPLLAILFTLPEISTTSMYVLIVLTSLESFIFSHEQFLFLNRRVFRSKSRFAFFFLSAIQYIMITVLYVLLALNTDEFDDYLGFVIEWTCAIMNGAFPIVACILMIYVAQCYLSGFPITSPVAIEVVAKIKWLFIIWSFGRLSRGVVDIISILHTWQRDLNSKIIAVIIFSILTLCEFVPFFFLLDWSTVSILLLGEDLTMETIRQQSDSITSSPSFSTRNSSSLNGSRYDHVSTNNNEITYHSEQDSTLHYKPPSIASPNHQDTPNTSTNINVINNTKKLAPRSILVNPNLASLAQKRSKNNESSSTSKSSIGSRSKSRNKKQTFSQEDRLPLLPEGDSDVEDDEIDSENDYDAMITSTSLSNLPPPHNNVVTASILTRTSSDVSSLNSIPNSTSPTSSSRNSDTTTSTSTSTSSTKNGNTDIYAFIDDVNNVDIPQPRLEISDISLPRAFFEKVDISRALLSLAAESASSSSLLSHVDAEPVKHGPQILADNGVWSTATGIVNHSAIDAKLMTSTTSKSSYPKVCVKRFHLVSTRKSAIQELAVEIEARSKITKKGKATPMNINTPDSANGQNVQNSQVSSQFVQVLGVSHDDTSVFIISEYLSRRSLFDLLRQTKRDFSPQGIIRVALQAALALEQAHNLGIIHGHLKSRNILLDEKMNVHIGDINIRLVKAFAETKFGHRFFTAWTAPEVLLGYAPTKAADVYSFGVICWELIMRREPFEMLTLTELVTSVGKNKVRLKFPSRLLALSQSLYDGQYGSNGSNGNTIVNIHDTNNANTNNIHDFVLPSSTVPYIMFPTILRCFGEAEYRPSFTDIVHVLTKCLQIVNTQKKQQQK